MRENVLISFKHEYWRLILSSWCGAIGGVINMKILLLGSFAYDLSISDLKLRIFLEIFKKFKISKVTKLWGLGELLVGSVTGNWVYYLDSQEYYLHFDRRYNLNINGVMAISIFDLLFELVT